MFIDAIDSHLQINDSAFTLLLYSFVHQMFPVIDTTVKRRPVGSFNFRTLFMVTTDVVFSALLILCVKA